MSQSGEQQVEKRELRVARVFEQPPDALLTYSDFAQVLGTGSEVVLQFYQTIPDVPGPHGEIQSVRSRLRATIVLSPAHARNLGGLLLRHAEGVEGGQVSSGTGTEMEGTQ